jgi:UDP-2,4-diacetamido-2,4,6-trideoxy-beta-L-altropyranose hydrolase
LKNSKIIVSIRVDASSNIGLGHIVRTFALAQILKKHYTIKFYCKEIPKPLEREITEGGFSVFRINNEEDFLNSISLNVIVVLDGYNFDSILQKRVKERGAKLVCIDDLNDKEFYADLIINYSPGINETDYAAQKQTQFALGLEYALLRPVFLSEAIKSKITKKIESVVVCFGGADPKQLTVETLRVLREFNQFAKIYVITGAAYQNIDSLLNIVKEDSRIEHFENLNDTQLAGVLVKSHLAIVPASNILLEALCCGCIPLTCYYVPNQQSFHNYLVRHFFINSFGNNSICFQEQELVVQISSILDGKYVKSNLSEKLNGVANRIITLFKHIQ